MALPEVEWRYVGSTAYTNNIVSALDAIYTLGTSSTYYDGSTRTPGSGSAGTYTRYQDGGTTEAVHAVPPTTTALAQKWIWAGSSSSHSPTMASPDTWNTNTLLVSINKNSGAYNAWDDAAPFTSGQFFGYWRMWNGSQGNGALHMFECEEAAIFAFARTSNGTVHMCAVGAFLNPYSTDAADAESDERLYGVYTSGTSSVGHMMGSSTSTTSFMGNGTSNGQTHTAHFTPGAGTLHSIQRNTEYGQVTQSPNQLAGGRFIYIKNSILVCKDSSTYHAAGMLREMAPFGGGVMGQVLSDGGSDIGYVLGKNASSSNDCILLFRNA